MTAQAPDQFFYEDVKLDLVGKEGENLKTAKDFGIETYSASTGCWRGYIMRYKIIEKKLVIEGFWVNPKTNILPEINGKKPEKLSKKNILSGLGFKYEYKNINKELLFNGSLWLAKDFIQSEYVHMGFQSPTAYRTVFKFDFKKGNLVNVEDNSKKVEKMRKIGDPKEYRPESMDPDVLHNWIMRRFSLNNPVEEDMPEISEKSNDKVKKEMLKELDRLNKLNDKSKNSKRI